MHPLVLGDDDCGLLLQVVGAGVGLVQLGGVVSTVLEPSSPSSSKNLSIQRSTEILSRPCPISAVAAAPRDVAQAATSSDSLANC